VVVGGGAREHTTQGGVMREGGGCEADRKQGLPRAQIKRLPHARTSSSRISTSYPSVLLLCDASATTVSFLSFRTCASVSLGRAASRAL
jgi:hypothetical protein